MYDNLYDYVNRIEVELYQGGEIGRYRVYQIIENYISDLVTLTETLIIWDTHGKTIRYTGVYNVLTMVCIHVGNTCTWPFKLQNWALY